ncbi:MAG: hypothetical protein ABW154_10820 [Dyella sp.]
MSRQNDIQRGVNDLSERASKRIRYYADEAGTSAQDLLQRGRQVSNRLHRNSHGYGEQLTRYAEDVADEANYQYRRLKRQVRRHPAATVAIVAGTLGAFLLLQRAFRSRDDD